MKLGLTTGCGLRSHAEFQRTLFQEEWARISVIEDFEEKLRRIREFVELLPKNT